MHIHELNMKKIKKDDYLQPEIVKSTENEQQPLK